MIRLQSLDVILFVVGACRRPYDGKTYFKLQLQGTDGFVPTVLRCERELPTPTQTSIPSVIMKVTWLISKDPN